MSGLSASAALVSKMSSFISIEAGDEIDLFEHPNQGRYPGQKISVVLIEGYAYLVPFVESESEIFLKTVIPSRKASKKHPGEFDE
jgi:hypothetical protein